MTAPLAPAATRSAPTEAFWTTPFFRKILMLGAIGLLWEGYGRWLANDLLFPTLWMFIGFVSSCDAYLTIKYQEQICYLESNPVGRLLLSLDGGEPGLFIGAKFLGTIMVLGFLTTLYRANRPMATLLTSALAVFQFGLLCYLFLR